jgi:hypothetical protein
MRELSDTTRRQSRKKRLAFGAMATLIVLSVVELTSWIAINVITADGLKAIHTVQDGLAIGGGGSGSLNETVHPYLGWVMNPETCPPTVVGGRSIPVNQFGFNDEEQPLPKRSADRLIVGFVGGSVAWQMSVQGESAFRAALRQNPSWRDRELRVVRLAMPGFKQPQQLMAVNYLLALGAEFDVIVNIDGYNEIALSACENEKSGVFAAYPRMWHARMLDVVDPRVSANSFRLLRIRAARQELARGIRESWFRWSPTFNLVWKIRDSCAERQLLDLAASLAEHKAGQGRGFAADGPRQFYTDENGLFDHLRDLWSNSSLQIHYLCRGNGTKYLHVLQPNQYLPGSKRLSALEREKMFSENQDYGKAIERGYPLLLEDGIRLRAQGVDFHNMTMLFAAVDEPVYADEYCHFNARGNEILARAVAEAIIDAFGSTADHK